MEERRYVSEIGRRMERGTSVASKTDIHNEDGICVGVLVCGAFDTKTCERFVVCICASVGI